MTYNVLRGTLNRTHSLTHSLTILTSRISQKLCILGTKFL